MLQDRSGGTRMQCRTRTCRSYPSSRSRYTVAVQTRSCEATSRTVRSDSVRSRGSNRVAKSSRSRGKSVVRWDLGSALTVRFDEAWGDSGRVVDAPFVQTPKPKYAVSIQTALRAVTRGKRVAPRHAGSLASVHFASGNLGDTSGRRTSAGVRGEPTNTRHC